MTVYIWLVVLLLAAAIMFRGNQKQSKGFIIVAFLLLFCVMGLRDANAFGADASGSHGSYPINYQLAGASEWTSLFSSGGKNYNIGFKYLMKLIYELSNGSYQFFITIISLFVVFSYVRFIKKYSSAPIQSVLYFLGLLYYSILFDILKQAIAMAILLFAFDAIIEKRRFKFIILVVLASLFHFPALVFLPAYWIVQIKVGRNYLILLAMLLLVTYIFRDQLLNLMLDAYGEGDVEATMAGIRFLRNKVVIMIAIVVFAIFIRPPTAEDTVYNALLMFAGISIILQTFCGYNNIFERLADYYFHTSIVFIPLIFEKNRVSEAGEINIGKEKLKSVVMLITCIFAIWRFLAYMNDSGLFLPYRFLWQR